MIHKPIIKELLRPRYHTLWNLNLTNRNIIIRNVDLIIELLDILKNLYVEQIDTEQGVTNTLITKVILGTVCCTPAYDRYFKEGLRIQGIHPHSDFSGNSLMSVIEFYQANRPEFESVKRDIQILSHISYPSMKLIDMYFWKIGRDIDN